MLDLHSPCVVIVGGCTEPNFIVKKILKCDNLPETLCLGENFEGYSWEIDTKYYKACVNICPIYHTATIQEKNINSVEALILYFDTQDVESFEEVKRWNASMKDIPEVVLLVCDSFQHDNSKGVCKSTALNWCLENGYELVELQEQDTEAEDYNDIIPDKKGVDRIIEALEAHTWSNLEMKSTCKPNGTHPSAMNSDLNLETDTEEFSELFSQLQSMKESIQSLPLRDRRNCAEQVVATFWKAIGGDEEELDDILP